MSRLEDFEWEADSRSVSAAQYEVYSRESAMLVKPAQILPKAHPETLLTVSLERVMSPLLTKDVAAHCAQSAQADTDASLMATARLPDRQGWAIGPVACEADQRNEAGIALLHWSVAALAVEKALVVHLARGKLAPSPAVHSFVRALPRRDGNAVQARLASQAVAASHFEGGPGGRLPLPDNAPGAGRMMDHTPPGHTAEGTLSLDPAAVLSGK